MAESQYPQSYGSWAGNPKGHAPDYTRCCQSVSGSEVWTRPHQCHRPRGYGPEEAYCKQHDPAAKAKRRQEADRRYAERTNKQRPQWHAHTFLAALRQIAAGHNDARGLAEEVVAKFDAGAMKVDP